MPDKTPRDAPKTFPQRAKRIWASAFNSAFDGTCKESGRRRDECSARVAIAAVKKVFRQTADGKWVPKAAFADVEMTITKASIQEDGSLRFQAVASDTSRDSTGEQTSIALFQDWIERAQAGNGVNFLPPPRTPFLGLSHYADLDGLGEAGLVDSMYIDGNRFKVNGIFHQDDGHPLGKLLFNAVHAERELIQRGETVDEPIRISAGWWDISHSHGNFVFERKSLEDRCPMCLPVLPRPKESPRGTDKMYLKGQLDHLAATRVPINPRTEIGLEEKSMAKTKRDDATSIIGDQPGGEELVEQLEEASNKPLGKSEAEAPEGMVVKADEEKREHEDEMHNNPGPALPFGGATSLKEADDMREAQRLEGEVFTQWGMFLTVADNILATTEAGEIKGKLKSLMSEFSSRIDAIKSAVEDAYLVTPAQGGIAMAENDKPVTGIEETIKATIGNKELNREAKLAAIQASIDGYVDTVKRDLDANNPPDVAEQVTRGLAPLLEKFDLLIAKMGGQPVQPQAQVQPQQKSMQPGIQPVQPLGNNELPISPETGKPSALTAMIRRSVGIQ